MHVFLLFYAFYPYFICFNALTLDILYGFYVILLYTCLSENSSGELML